MDVEEVNKYYRELKEMIKNAEKKETETAQKLEKLYRAIRIEDGKRAEAEEKNDKVTIKDTTANIEKITGEINELIKQQEEEKNIIANSTRKVEELVMELANKPETKDRINHELAQRYKQRINRLEKQRAEKDAINVKISRLEKIQEVKNSDPKLSENLNEVLDAKVKANNTRYAIEKAKKEGKDKTEITKIEEKLNKANSEYYTKLVFIQNKFDEKGVDIKDSDIELIVKDGYRLGKDSNLAISKKIDKLKENRENWEIKLKENQEKYEKVMDLLNRPNNIYRYSGIPIAKPVKKQSFLQKIRNFFRRNKNKEIDSPIETREEDLEATQEIPIIKDEEELEISKHDKYIDKLAREESTKISRDTYRHFDVELRKDLEKKVEEELEK